MTTKQAKEAQLQQIFRMLLENKTQEDIAHELNIGLKTVWRYSQDIDKRYGETQRRKTDDTLFMECQLFKNRMLTLYNGLEATVKSLAASGTEKAKCAEVAANIAIDVLKMESEGIKAVRDLGLGYYGKANRLLNSIQQRYATSELRDSRIDEVVNESTTTTTTDTSTTSTRPTESNPNRKF